MPSSDFYDEYHGHKVEHLRVAHAALGNRPRIWLAGDSSLDCKHYIPSSNTPAINQYEKFLVPPVSKRDVCYWLNAALGPRYAVLNCAVEESTIARRQDDLLPQDVFIRDNISADDVLVVSVGGNDIVLRPSMATIFNIIKAVHFNSTDKIKSHPRRVWGMDHFRGLFCDMTRSYIEKLVSRARPRKVVVCMIYHPDEANVPSWAGPSLSFLKYSSKPELLQAMIEAVYECATKEIQIENLQVVACPLFQVMNGKDSSLYVDRVEPSEKGGRAMSELISRYILTGNGNS